jgi:hypothetical protein
MRYAALLGGFAMLIAVQSSAAPCSSTCTATTCSSVCAQAEGCYSFSPTVRCAGRQAYCDITCNNGVVAHMYCDDPCYTSGGGGSGSPVFARKPVEEPPSP